MPNLRREVRQAIGKARAGWTFTTICTELGYACHTGRATWDQQRLGIGLRALARESGQDVRKVRRDCAALAELGLVVVHRPKVLHVHDPATGKIVTKARGRCENTTIYLTITEAALRPAKGRSGTEGGTTVVPPPAACKGAGGTTDREEKKQRTPAGVADGIGPPPAVPAGRLPAAEAAAAPPAPIIPMDAGQDEPALPAGRLIRETPATPPRRSGPPRERHPEDSRPWDQQHLDAWERTRQRLAADEERRRREDDQARAIREAEERQRQAEAPPTPPEPDLPPEAAPEASADELLIRQAIEAARARKAVA